MNRTKRLSVLISFVCLALITVITGCAKPQETVRLAYGAGNSGSALYTIHVAISKAIAKYAPGVEATLVETAGGADTWKRVSEGQLQLGMFSTTDWYELYHGVGGQEGKQRADVRGLYPILPNMYHFVVRADSQIFSFKDLQGQKFNPGPKGTMQELQVQAMLNELGIKPNSFSADYKEAVEQYRNRNIVGFERSMGVPDSAIVEVGLTVPFRLIGVTDEEWAKVSKILPGNVKMTIPAGSYTGQDKPIQTTGVVSGVGTTRDLMTVDTAYKLVKAYSQGFNEFVKPLHPMYAAVETPEDYIIETAKSPLHAGVIKYLREKGKTIPDYLVPPEAK